MHITFTREYNNAYDQNSVLVSIKKSKNVLGHLERKFVAAIMDQKYPELVYVCFLQREKYQSSCVCLCRTCISGREFLVISDSTKGYWGH